MVAFLRRYLIAGLLLWVPLGVTLLVVKLLVDIMDRTLVLIPQHYRPEALLGFSIPGLGLLLSLLIVLLTGIAVAHFAGHKLVALWEAIVARIPLVNSVYGGVKQVAETMFTGAGQSFRKVVLVPWPRAGAWTMGFLTATSAGEVSSRLGREVVSVYVPTTPNPTGGYFMIFPREEVVELSMSVDEGLKMIISMGVVVPKQGPHPELDGVALKPSSE